ncbi:hypothetical protein Tco_1397148, partial [Tanacetum coccineum]
MSDSEDSTVTYTAVSSPFEDGSDIGSPGVDGPPIMPEDPYAYIMAAYQVPPSPDYIPGLEEPQSPPPLDFVPELMYPEYIQQKDEILPTEEQPLPAVASPIADSPGYVPESDPEEEPSGDDDDDDDDEDEDEEEEEHPALADSVPPVHRMTARISIRDEPSISLPPREEVERLLALTTPPPSPLTLLLSPLPHIPSPPFTASPPASLIRPLGYQTAMIRLRAETPSTSHPLPLPTSSPPLQLLSSDGIFANMKRAGKDFSKRITPLFDTMMVQPVEEMGEDSDHPTDSTPIHIIDQPSSSSQPKKKQPSKKAQRHEAEVLQDEAEHEESVLDLQKAKDAQAKEIVALKKRIQRLERRKMSRPTGLKILRKVGMSRRVESSEDQESLGAPEDASKQGRSIEDIDADVDVFLVDETQERQDDDLMFNTGVLEDDEMHVEAKVDGKYEQSTKPDDSTVGEAVTTASVDDSVVPTTIEEITLAQTLIQIKAAKPKVVTTAATTTTTTRPKDKGVVVQEPSEFRVPQETQPSSSKDKGKGIMIEPEVPLKRKDQIALDEQIARDIQAKLDAELLEEQKLARKQEEEANIALIESWENTQAMMEADRLLAERLQSKEREELTDEEKAKLFMELMEKRRKHFAALRAQEKRNRPPTKAQKRTQMSTYLKHMEGREETAKGSRKKMLGRKRAVKEQQKESSKKLKVEEEKESEEVEEDDEVELKKLLVIKKDEDIAFADGSSKRYSSTIRMLQGIDREDLEALWRIVKAKYGDIRLEDEFERVLYGDLRVIFEPDIKSDVWRMLQGYRVATWKLIDSSRVHF